MHCYNSQRYSEVGGGGGVIICEMHGRLNAIHLKFKYILKVPLNQILKVKKVFLSPYCIPTSYILIQLLLLLLLYTYRPSQSDTHWGKDKTTDRGLDNY